MEFSAISRRGFPKIGVLFLGIRILVGGITCPLDSSFQTWLSLLMSAQALRCECRVRIGFGVRGLWVLN